MKRKPLLVALLAVVLGAALFLRRPPPVPPIALHPSPRQAARAQSHMEALQQELQPEEAPQKSASAGHQRPAPPRARTLRLSEEDLNVTLAGNRAVRKMLAAGGVKAVQIILSEPANLTVRAAVLVNGHPQNVQLDGRLAPDPKLGVRYTATHAQVGRLPLPPATVTAQANALAARLEGRMKGHLPLTVQSVRVQGKMLVLTGILVSPPPVRPSGPASPPPASPARR